MDTLEDLLELKRLRDDKGFAHLVAVYDRQLSRLKERLFAADTTDEEVVRLKWGIRRLNECHPEGLLKTEIKATESRVEKAHAANTK